MNYAQQELVSIGIPTYNRPDGLRRTLESVTGQTYRNLEIIVSDNCSTDPDVNRIVHEFLRRDQRIKYVRQAENKGAARNFRFVLDNATGRYFMWTADDDWWDCDFIEEAVKAVERRSDIVACWSGVSFNDEAGRVMWPEPYDRYDNPDLARESTVNRLLRYHSQYGWYGIYALFRTEVIRRAVSRHLKESQAPWGDDVLMMTEVLLSGKVAKIPRPSFHYTNRTVSSYDVHLSRPASYGILARANPYLSQILSLVRCVLGSRSLRIGEKALYYSRFLLSITRADSVWTAVIGRRPRRRFYLLLLKRCEVIELMLASTVQLATLAHRILGLSNRAGTWLLNVFRRPVRLIRQIASVMDLVLSMPSRPRALIVEPNPCHGEVVIGVGGDLLELGYNVQFLVSNEIGNENPFCRVPRELSRKYYLGYRAILRLIRSRLMTAYDLVILTSSFDYRSGGLFLETYSLPFQPRHGFLFVEHDLRNVDPSRTISFGAYKASRLLVLTNYAGDDNLTEIAPAYFGNVVWTKTKRAPTVFVVPGTYFRDIDSLIDGASLLVGRGISAFRFVIMGAFADGRASARVDAMGLREQVKLVGRVSFSVLYDQIETAHYLVGPQDVAHYLDNVTSGSKFLSLGFAKPLIVRRELAERWGFASTNCITYEEGEELAQVLEGAIVLAEREYEAFVRSLHEKRAAAHSASLERIKRLLKRLAAFP